LLHTTCGTPNYVAPEVLADKGYDGRMADIWSMGVILFVLHSGYLPFDEPHMSALFRKIQKAQYVFPTWFSEEIKDFISKILVADPAQRLTLAQILESPWFVGSDNFKLASEEVDNVSATLDRAASVENMSAAVAEIVGDDDLGSSLTSPKKLAASGISSAGGRIKPDDSAKLQLKLPDAADKPLSSTSSMTRVLDLSSSLKPAAVKGPEADGWISLSHSASASVPSSLSAAEAALILGQVKLSSLVPYELKASPTDGQHPLLSRIDANALLCRVVTALVSAGFDTTTDSRGFKVKGSIKTGRGESELSATLRALDADSGVIFIDITRVHGEQLVFKQLCEDLRGALKDVLLADPSL
jgi:serine/threonine protein kinase